MFSRNFVLFSIVLSSMLIAVTAISCYQCNSAQNPECNDLGSYRPHLTAGFFKECTEYLKYNNSVPFCRKTVIEVLLPDKVLRTTRSCGWIKHRRPCYKADNEGHLETSCQCFESGCNGSSNLYTMSAISLFILGVVVFKL
ncbi:hypothetical protein HA402_012833 [Bradysia odoriphaga]|nr:hypothetical protein HA402_012833 [Bradysia odoriphaga]